eukprot:7468599-Pyramimonas_sp.AAC.6
MVAATFGPVLPGDSVTYVDGQDCEVKRVLALADDYAFKVVALMLSPMTLSQPSPPSSTYHSFVA